MNKCSCTKLINPVLLFKRFLYQSYASKNATIMKIIAYYELIGQNVSQKSAGLGRVSSLLKEYSDHLRNY